MSEHCQESSLCVSCDIQILGDLCGNDLRLSDALLFTHYNVLGQRVLQECGQHFSNEEINASLMCMFPHSWSKHISNEKINASLENT